MANDSCRHLRGSFITQQQLILDGCARLFTKWVDAIPLPDQMATRITAELVKLCSVIGVPEILHLDQGQNFESTLLRSTLEVFGVVKSHTTAYHPQGDGMVERFNRSLLQLLRTYVEKENEWERYLPLVLFAYRTATHSSTGVSPFTLMFGRPPKHFCDFSSSHSFDPGTYQAQLEAKLADLRDFVEANVTQAAHSQKDYYDRHSMQHSFKEGDPIWLSVPTAGKLQPRWEGEWRIKAVKSPITMEITDDKRTKIVHVNRLRHRIQPGEGSESQSVNTYPWTAPQIEHMILPPIPPPPAHRYPQREQHPPNYFSH